MPIRIGSTVVANLMVGTAQVQKVFLGTVQIWANEVVIALGNVSDVLLLPLFTTGQWSDPNLKKKVVVPSAGAVGATSREFAIAVAAPGTAQADSWAGDLTLEVRGTVSGMGGAANSGIGGHVIWANLLGRLGQKLKVNLIGGLLRSGGGGGGRAGNGGPGNFAYTAQENRSDLVWRSTRTNLGNDQYQVVVEVFWAGAYVTGWSASGHYEHSPVNEPAALSAGGITYYRGAGIGSSSPNGSTFINNFNGYRTFTAYQPTSGGIAGNPGRGQGSDGAATLGASPVAGGTNAGASGKSGDGGGWGQPGQAGTVGASGNVGAGLAGAAGGLAGLYLREIANIDFTNSAGTVLGRTA